MQITQNRTVCLSFRDNVADWQRSSKVTIRELFSAAREQETRGGDCFHLVRHARPQCNNHLADCHTIKRVLNGELEAGHSFSCQSLYSLKHSVKLNIFSAVFKFVLQYIIILMYSVLRVITHTQDAAFFT